MTRIWMGILIYLGIIQTISSLLELFTGKGSDVIPSLTLLRMLSYSLVALFFKVFKSTRKYSFLLSHALNMIIFVLLSRQFEYYFYMWTTVFFYLGLLSNSVAVATSWILSIAINVVLSTMFFYFYKDNMTSNLQYEIGNYLFITVTLSIIMYKAEKISKEAFCSSKENERMNRQWTKILQMLPQGVAIV